MNTDEPVPVNAEVFSWTRSQIETAQGERLLTVGEAAREHSPFWRERLPTGPLTIESLRLLPPLTKNELIENWNAISVVNGLTLEAAEAALDAGDGREVAGCRIHGSSGSSGRVAVMANGPRYWTDIAAVALRHAVRHITTTGTVPRTDPAVVLMGDSPRHGSFHTLVGAPRISPRAPEGELIDRLAALQPALLLGLASQVQRVAHAIMTGRLSITPDIVMVAGEPLDRRAATLVRAAFPNAFTSNVYACTEVGPIAQGPIGEPLEIDEDRVLVEVVDANNTPVSAGTPGSKVLVTPLYWRELPLFRYELSDEVTLSHEPGRSSLRHIREVSGRSDDEFRYEEIVVHPNLFRAALTRPAITGYQVTQTERGATIALTVDRSIDTQELAAELTTALRGTGLPDANVQFTIVGELPRVGLTQKLRRFVPVAHQ